MALFNHAKKEINVKIIYYGPSGSGKSTAINYIYSRIKPALRGELKCIPAGGDNLLFFDFSPFEAALPDGYHVRLHIYTLTGPVTNPATWKMTLKGADGIVVMVDTVPEHLPLATEAVSQLRDYLSAYGVGLNDSPAILQLNDHDNSSQIMDDSEMAFALDLPCLPVCRSNASSGEGVLDALTTLSRMVLDQVVVKEKPVAMSDPSPPEYDNLDLELSNKSDYGSDQNCEKLEAYSEHSEAPQVSLSSQDITYEGSVIRLPLDISIGNSRRRVIVSVSVETE